MSIASEHGRAQYDVSVHRKSDATFPHPPRIGIVIHVDESNYSPAEHVAVTEKRVAVHREADDIAEAIKNCLNRDTAIITVGPRTELHASMPRSLADVLREKTGADNLAEACVAGLRAYLASVGVDVDEYKALMP